jgi:NAD(P)-dependent dehydrogenase (short-subunit alcohol dehydrogenase family)
MELQGRTAVVTGAGSGIGLGVARALAEAHVNVALVDIEEAALAAARETLSGINVQFGSYVVDVADRQAMYDLARQVEADFGQIDILHNNAGVGYAGTPLDEIPDTDYVWVVGVNLWGPINGVRAFEPLIKKHGRGGHIVNTSSIGGFQVKDGWHHGLYALTKYAVVAYSEGLRQDLAPHGIGVSVLAPAAVRTNLFQSGRNRPERYGGAFRREGDHPVARMVAETGMDPYEAGKLVRYAIRHNELYVFTHGDTRSWLEERHAQMMAGFDLVDQFATGNIAVDE